MNNNKSDQKVARKKYSPQFKDQALERAVKDGIPQVALFLSSIIKQNRGLILVILLGCASCEYE